MTTPTNYPSSSTRAPAPPIGGGFIYDPAARTDMHAPTNQDGQPAVLQTGNRGRTGAPPPVAAPPVQPAHPAQLPGQPRIVVLPNGTRIIVPQ